MDDLETCIAVVFKRKGKNIITETEFIFAISLDYRWFTPDEAKKLLSIALKKGLLIKSDDFLKPSFDPKDADASLSFRPDKDILNENKAAEEYSVFSRLVKDISAQSGSKKRDVVARINKLQEKLGVDVEVAALLIARDEGLDARSYVEDVRKEVSSK